MSTEDGAGKSSEFEAMEREVTGRAWKDCAVCGECRIPAEWNPPWCTDCGGPRVNCRHCRRGRHWWYGSKPPYECTGCGKNPLDAPPGTT